MGRPRGTRNPRFDERRHAIARAVMAHLARPGGAQSSLRELAAAAGVGQPTIRHYFGDRAGLVRAALDEMREGGAPWLEITRALGTDQPLADSLVWFVGMFVTGWEHGVGLRMSQALAAGMDDPALGPATVDALLEPVLQAVEARLGVHRDQGELAADADLRHAALALVSPLLLGLLHQRSLGGSGCRPLDLQAFAADHVARFVRGWGTR